MAEVEVGPVASLGEGRVVEAGPWAVGDNGERFAVSKRCRHLAGPLAEGSIDDDGCLVCPWHGATYDVTTGEMQRGPQGVFAKVPGLGTFFRTLTRVLPLRRGDVVDLDGTLVVR